MKDTSALKRAVAVAVSKSSNEILAKEIPDDKLFSLGRDGGGSLISPSWATPRKKINGGAIY